jgi:mono/diheme cytochrome c family protein
MRRALALAGLLVTGMVLTALAHDDWKAPAAERDRPNPVPESPMAVSKGRGLYMKHCRSCHGDTGKGDGDRAEYSPRKPHDLTDPALQKKFTDGEAYWKITTGRKEEGDVIMPAFAVKIPDDDDRWRLVHFVRTLVVQP